jgi:hypothetical protein
MSDLSPELQKLVLAGKEASLPTAADFDRVGSALQARHFDVVLPASALASATASKWFLRGASSKVIGLAAVSLMLVVGSLAQCANGHFRRRWHRPSGPSWKSTCGFSAGSPCALAAS